MGALEKYLNEQLNTSPETTVTWTLPVDEPEVHDVVYFVPDTIEAVWRGQAFMYLILSGNTDSGVFVERKYKRTKDIPDRYKSYAVYANLLSSDKPHEPILE